VQANSPERAAVPAAHATHDDEAPEPACTDPAAQPEHALEPGDEYDPARQGTQDDESSAPPADE
jgi:hypothetical protein